MSRISWGTESIWVFNILCRPDFMRHWVLQRPATPTPTQKGRWTHQVGLKKEFYQKAQCIMYLLWKCTCAPSPAPHHNMHGIWNNCIDRPNYDH